MVKWPLLLCGCLAAQTIDIGDRRQLLMDDRFVQQARGVEIRVHEAKKTGDIAIPEEEDWGLGGYSSVLYHGGVYHMWYTAHTAICYAQSSDGIHWERPKLNLTTVEKHADNNIVLGFGAGGVMGETHGVMVFIDPHASAAERFRLVANPHEFTKMLQLFSSPDGIHWKRTHQNIIVYDENKRPHHLDTQNVIFWDDRVGKYVAYIRHSSHERGRMIGRVEAKDLSSFGTVEGNSRIVFNSDAVNIRRFDPKRKTELPLIDAYTNGAIKYPWADDAYFLFPAMYYHYGMFHHEYRDDAPTNAGVIDTRIATSRDGIQWNTHDWRPFVGTGMAGEFDSRRIYMTYGIVPAKNGREMYMYYVGTNDTHGWNRDDRNNRLLTAGGVAPQPLGRAISRVVIRRDGFVSVRAPNSVGEFTTPPLKFRGNQLVLNVDTSALGEVQVELQDESGAPIPGFTLAEADVIHSANEISRPVTWRGMSELEKLAGRTVRLKFSIRNADVYAFQFRDRPAI